MILASSLLIQYFSHFIVYMFYLFPYKYSLCSCLTPAAHKNNNAKQHEWDEIKKTLPGKWCKCKYGNKKTKYNDQQEKKLK